MKLVRDKIPILFKMENTHIADEAEYLSALDAKLREEVAEYLQDHAPEELADVLEVVYALAAARGVSQEELEQLRKKKADARGSFKKRIIWER